MDKKARLIVLALLVAALFVLEPPLNAAQQEVTLQGRLHVMIGDPLPGQALTPLPVYVLVDVQGSSTYLVIDPSRAEELDGQWVEVRGPWMTPGEVLQVDYAIPLSEPFESMASSGGSQAWVNILCRYADRAEITPHPVEFYEALVFGGQYGQLDHFWRAVSNGIANLDGSDIVGWVNLPEPAANYGAYEFYPDFGKLLTHCIALVDDEVYFPDFAGINLLINGATGCCAWGVEWELTLDGVTKPYGITWMPEIVHSLQYYYVHEMGHGFRLPHIWLTLPNGADYGDPWDLMGGDGNTGDCDRSGVYHPIYGCIAVSATARHMQIPGWLPADRVISVTAGSATTVELERLHEPTRTDRYLVAEVPISGSTTHYYTVEARKKVGYDDHLVYEGVIIHEVNTETQRSILQYDARDPDPAFAGAAWIPGEVFDDTINDIHIQVLSGDTTGFTVRISNAATAFSCTTQSAIPVDECEALVALYNSTDGAHWNNHSGWLMGSSPCTWHGVTCNGTPNHVTSLVLSYNNLVGSIPHEIGDLEYLTSLNLGVNQLHGTIPDRIGNLWRLVGLELGFNHFDGAIPETLDHLQRLEYLGLFNAGLTGEIPYSIDGMINLRILDLGQNNLTGEIPWSIGDLTRLTSIDLGTNRLSQEIPTTLLNLTALTNLDLSDNQCLKSRNTAVRNLVTSLDPDWEGTQVCIVYPVLVDTFTLVNADNDEDILTLREGDIIYLSNLPSSNLNIRANTVPRSTGSVVFYMNGYYMGTDNARPYAVGGDQPRGNYLPMSLPPGVYDLTAVPFTLANGQGTQGQPRTIHFTLIGPEGSTMPGEQPPVTNLPPAEAPFQSGEGQWTEPELDGGGE
jgi:hypothetical protein